MKKILFLPLFLIFTSLYSAEWTIIFYFAADNGLYENALKDINELEAGIQDNMNIIAFIDHPEGSEVNGAEVLKIKRDSTDSIVSKSIKYYGNINSGDYRTLASFTKWALNKYPAQKTTLNIWSHGTGWFKNQEYDTKYTCPDNSFNNAISIANGDFRKAFQLINHKFDLVVLDACLMGNIETMTEMKDYSDYLIASPIEVPVFGFPWNDILYNWNETDNLDVLTSHIVDYYCESYWPGGSQNPQGNYQFLTSAFSAKMSALDSLLTEFKTFSNKYALASSNEVFTKSRNQCSAFNDMLADIELIQYFTVLKNNAENDSSLSLDCQSILNKINNLFIAKNSLGTGLDGVALFWYPTLESMFTTLYHDLYHKLIFSDYQFPRFLNYSFGPDLVKPNPITNLSVKQSLSTLYLNWDIPIDACPLKYQIKVFENNVFVALYYTTLNYFEYNLSQENNEIRFQICTIDEAGNESNSVSSAFSPNLINQFTAYVCPNPVNNLNNAQIKFFLLHPTSKLHISIYNIAGDLLGHKTLTELSSGEHSIDLNHLILNNNKMSSGLYTIIIKANDLSYHFKFTMLY